MNIVILGQSITSSWRNGHAATFRGLVRELNNRNHQVLFLERDMPRYFIHRDLQNPDYCKIELYNSLQDLEQRFTEQVREADLVIVGSYIIEGIQVGEWVQKIATGIKGFYDSDTLVTLKKLEREDYEYLHPDMIPKYDMYLSSTGGPMLDILEQKYGSPMARPLYCAFDPDLYYPDQQELKWDLGYLGTYSDDRQPHLEKLVLDAARAWPDGRFVVAGSQYPENIEWPKNTEYIDYLPPSEHRLFYNSQRFTQNIISTDVLNTGYTPNTRLFEAAACCTPIISDYWEGLDTFFDFDTEILISYSAGDTLKYLREICNSERKAIGARAHKKVMAHHTVAHRAQELESYMQELMTLSGTKESEINVEVI
jgi:spore maturation protein CgeB